MAASAIRTSTSKKWSIASNLHQPEIFPSLQNLNQEAAQQLFEGIKQSHNIILTLADAYHSEAWFKALSAISEHPKSHGLLAGRATRLLYEGKKLSKELSLSRLGLALNIEAISLQIEASLEQSAFWLQGFLEGGGLLLIHDKALWDLLDNWVLSLEAASFIDILPLLRRTFSTFSKSLRQQLFENRC
ncbi:MAG: DUF5682 family protein [Deinococcales bacterium]